MAKELRNIEVMGRLDFERLGDAFNLIPALTLYECQDVNTIQSPVAAPQDLVLPRKKDAFQQLLPQTRQLVSRWDGVLFRSCFGSSEPSGYHLRQGIVFIKPIHATLQGHLAMQTLAPSQRKSVLAQKMVDALLSFWEGCPYVKQASRSESGTRYHPVSSNIQFPFCQAWVGSISYQVALQRARPCRGKPS